MTRLRYIQYKHCSVFVKPSVADMISIFFNFDITDGMYLLFHSTALRSSVTLDLLVTATQSHA